MKRRHIRSRAGVTLLELLIVVGLVALLTAAVGYAFVAGLDMQRLHTQRQADQGRTEAMEQRIMLMLQGAVLGEDEEDATTYFQTTTGGGTGDLGAEELTWTTTSPGVPMATLGSEDDFETQHGIRGPVGGVAEVGLSTYARGDAGDRTGLFERVQRPSDGDPTQGGTESLLAPEVTEIGFQFWDGAQWIAAWDTSAGERRLPAAVRVSYILAGSPGGAPRVLVVPIPASDIDSSNPAGAGL